MSYVIEVTMPFCDWDVEHKVPRMKPIYISDGNLDHEGQFFFTYSLERAMRFETMAQAEAHFLRLRQRHGNWIVGDMTAVVALSTEGAGTLGTERASGKFLYPHENQFTQR